ncbi:tuberoinfundibular peptide of 39 residues [Carassius carassius]|uniref:tuberoinfundibular peptide of 39 residues n=1 Tax=Carassius carassius TaxID=217509 RepID=UPI0028692E16|nr:tuberoinfundibular peptide of 39 residues [Carassius carassius]
MEDLQTSLESHKTDWIFDSRQRTSQQQTAKRKSFSTKMVALPLPLRPAILFLVLMSVTLMTSAFPQPQLRPLQSNLPAIGQEDSKSEQWEVLYPSISLRDWSIQMLTAPDFGAAKTGTEQLVGDDWLPLSQSQMEEELVKGWPGNWPSRVGHQQKRNIVVADDAAFREKSKLLTAMERQKWLNSYMQKLLVVNSK